MNASPAYFASAFGAAFLMVLSVSIRPPLAVTVGIMLGAAGLACLYWRQYARLAGLCIGFAPILLIPLHNWYFGGVFVPISANMAAPNVLMMTPLAYLEALENRGKVWLLVAVLAWVLASLSMFYFLFYIAFFVMFHGSFVWVHDRQRPQGWNVKVALITTSATLVLLLPLLVPMLLARLEAAAADPFASVEVPQWRRQWVLWRAASRWPKV